VLLLSSIGFLVYSYLTAQRRALEFAILRTLGFSRGQVFSLVAFEHLFVIVTGMGLGTVVGLQVGRMMMEFLSTDENGRQVLPPFILGVAWPSVFAAWGILGTVFIMTIAAVVLLYWRLAVHRALRIGDAWLHEQIVSAAATDTPYIHCQDLFKIYQTEELEVVALRGLDLRVGRGEMMAIVGASGSGKTTLLNILAGLDRPSAGQIRVGDRDLLTTTEDDLVTYRRSEVGFLWQQAGRNMIPYLGAGQNVEVPMILEGVSGRQARRRAEQLLDQVGLLEKRRNRPDQLSGGEQQRVAIAIALANNPPLLLADEPTGELDTATAEQVYRVFRDLNEALGVTIVIVTHDATIAQRVDRVVAMRDGRTSTELVRRAAFSRGEGEIVEQFTVVDRSGRLQISREHVEALGLGERARVNLAGDHVEVRPERRLEDHQPPWRRR
jgi:ABC-type lipoprotein export system ATPase subunit